MSEYKIPQNKELRIAISGKSGCGNTTVSTLLSQKLNVTLINFTFRQLAAEKNMTLAEVIEAAKTKPYGFQAFYPGPGLGGHCIPVDPYYLSWKAREFAFHTSMIESSMKINDKMPQYCAERAGRILNRFKKALNGSKIQL